MLFSLTVSLCILESIAIHSMWLTGIGVAGVILFGKVWIHASLLWETNRRVCVSDNCGKQVFSEMRFQSEIAHYQHK